MALFGQPRLIYKSEQKGMIEEKYLQALEAKISNSFSESNRNPFNLTFVQQLTHYQQFYKFKHFHPIYTDRQTIQPALSDEVGATTYLNFLKQYHLAYITLLRAINGSARAIADVQILFKTSIMFIAANANLEYLDIYGPFAGVNASDEGVKKFLLALLAYLILDIVYSPHDQITSMTRVGALRLIREHFESEKLINAFNDFSYSYCKDGKSLESVFEDGGNSLQEKSCIIAGDFDHFFFKRRMEILRDFLRADPLGHYADRGIRKKVFFSIFKLALLDDANVEHTFGAEASFRENQDKIAEKRLGL